MSGDHRVITVPVDVTNPGQFYACCGLFELADRRSPGAQGWFSPDGAFVLSTTSVAFTELVQGVLTADVRSSLNPAQLKRLGKLMSIAKAELSNEDREEKECLHQMWRVEAVLLGPPFDLRLDWWRDERGDRLEPKTWAAKQLLMDIIGDLRAGASRIRIAGEKDLWQWVDRVDRRFNFDSHLGALGSALDVGFSFDALGDSVRTRIDLPCRPLLELLAFFGLQRCRPKPLGGGALGYTAWHVPLPVTVLSVAATGLVPVHATNWRFFLKDRSDYFKCFSPAVPDKGDCDE